VAMRRRAGVRFHTGECPPARVAGHVCGAVNLPFREELEAFFFANQKRRAAGCGTAVLLYCEYSQMRAPRGYGAQRAHTAVRPALTTAPSADAAAGGSETEIASCRGLRASPT
jgi:hypothetical protein